MVFEAHRDWAEAERLFGKMLQVELEPDMRRRALFARGRCLEAQGRWKEAIAALEQTLPLCAELDQTLESLRRLFDELERQPNSIIFGRDPGEDLRPPSGTQ